MKVIGLFTIMVLLFGLSLDRQSVAATSTLQFAVIGDYGWGDANEAAVAALVKSWNPAFIITVGDNNYPLGESTTIDDHIGKYYAEYIYPYTGAYTATATTNRFYPTLGNHDWYTPGATPYLNYFSSPINNRYYDFVQGPIHFFALDSDPNEPDGISITATQAIWLHSQLAASTSCWNLVYLHHAPYSSASHGSNPTLQWDYRQWGADAVFAGHDHVYERIDVGGIPYFVDGAGGAPLYSFGTPVAGSQFRASVFGAMRVTATSSQITYEFISTDGTTLDTSIQNGGCAIFLPVVLR